MIISTGVPGNGEPGRLEFGSLGLGKSVHGEDSWGYDMAIRLMRAQNTPGTVKSPGPPKPEPSTHLPLWAIRPLGCLNLSLIGS